MWIVKHRKIWYAISIILVGGSLFSIFYFGLNLGIDYTGGSLLEVEYADQRPGTEDLQSYVSKLGYGNISIQPAGEKGYILKLRNLNEEEHQKLLQAVKLEGKSPAEEKRFDSIGPTIGKELKQKSLLAVSLVSLMIVLYIAFVFRKVSRPVSSFYYGLFAVAALLHDITIPTGIFAALGRFMGVEIDILFITAILTILGFSVHDTIVVYDRIRENLKKGVIKDFEETVGLSVKQTAVRSINTSLTVMLVLLVVFFFGGESTKYFSLTLILGVFFGTYSSIFLASPLLVSLNKIQAKKRK